MNARPFPFLAAVLCLGQLSAQDFDIYIKGRITDVVTGQPIPFASLEVTDQLDAEFSAPSQADVKGLYTRELYSGWKYDGGMYLVEFTATGYHPRLAMIDASEVDKGAEEAMAWRINMDVALKPVPAGTTPQPAPLLGVCVWSKQLKTLRWNEEAPRRLYPIERYKEERILAHRAIVDSALVKQGLMIDGVVRDQWTEAPLGGVAIKVTSEPGTASLDTTYITDALGYYAIVVPYTGTYQLDFGREGLVHKRVVVDPSTVPMDEHPGGFRANVDIRLFGPIAGEDLSFLDAPIGRLSYNATEANMAWDMTLSRPILERLNGILEQHAPKTTGKKAR